MSDVVRDNHLFKFPAPIAYDEGGYTVTQSDGRTYLLGALVQLEGGSGVAVRAEMGTVSDAILYAAFAAYRLMRPVIMPGLNGRDLSILPADLAAAQQLDADDAAIILRRFDAVRGHGLSDPEKLIVGAAAVALCARYYAHEE